jgi:MarR family transcriptional regulator for hemolysin
MANVISQADMTTTLVRLARVYRLAVDKVLSEIGLSDALALPVAVLARHPEGIRQNALAYELGVEGPSLVRLLDRLVEDGLVERREDATDRRAKIVRLTPAGRALGGQALEVLDHFRAGVLEGVEAADIQACLRVFRAMEDRLSAARRDARP